MGKWNIENIQEYLSKFGSVLLSKEYKNNKQKLQIQCRCGEIFCNSMNEVVSNNRYQCVYCSGSKLSYKHVKEQIESKGCFLLSDKYVNSNSKLDIRCNCGNEYKVDFNTFKKGQTRCKKCYWKENHHHNKLNFKDVKKYIEENSDCKLISTDYLNCFEKLEVKCRCGKVFKSPFNHLKYQKEIQCPTCSVDKVNESFRFSQEDVQKRMDEKYNGEYSIYDFSNYKNIKDSIILFKHNACGKIFKSTVHSALHGLFKCGKCQKKLSRGERRISLWLDKKNENYSFEFGFKDCRHMKKLLFDFYLADYNLCIEYDGEQHFKPIERFGGDNGFEMTKLRDEIKNEYCKKNNINLLRIKYTDFKNIETILNDYFNEHVNTELTTESKESVAM